MILHFYGCPYVTNCNILSLLLNFTIRPSTGVYESRTLSLIYYELFLTLVSSNYFVNNSKYPTSVDLVILNPSITVFFMEKFNPTITYLVSYITEGFDNKNLLLYFLK